MSNRVVGDEFLQRDGSLLAVVVWFGRHAVEEIQAMESWIAGHGVWGWIAFVGMVVVFTSMTDGSGEGRVGLANIFQFIDFRTKCQ